MTHTHTHIKFTTEINATGTEVGWLLFPQQINCFISTNSKRVYRNDFLFSIFMKLFIVCNVFPFQSCAFFSLYESCSHQEKNSPKKILSQKYRVFLISGKIISGKNGNVVVKIDAGRSQLGGETVKGCFDPLNKVDVLK